MAYSFLENALSSLLKSLPSSLLAKIQFSPRIKAISIVLLVLLASFVMGWVAFFTAHKYLPLAVLGVFYGVILSYPATKLLGPKLQSALGGMIGGLSSGNIGTTFASGTTVIRSLSKSITTAVHQAVGAIMFGDPKAELLETGIVFCIWMALITMLLIIAASAYLGEVPTAAVAAPAETAQGKAAGKDA